MKQDVSETTQLLLGWVKGDAAAMQALIPHIYQELRKMAAGFANRERRHQSLQATALVHEVYLKLVDVRQVDWKSKAHFYAACSQMMRRILVDAARKRHASKHGAGLERFNVDDVLDLGVTKNERLIELDEALRELEQMDPRRARMVELRYFGGLSVQETAEALGVSVETVTRDWRLARGWLLSQMRA